jgi:hypothetical protein
LRPRHHLLLAFLLAILTLLASCGRKPQTVESGPTLPLDASWMGVLLREPARFSALMESTPRDGWIAYHKADYSTASELFRGEDPKLRLLRGRAQVELQLLFQDLDRSAAFISQKGFDKWRERKAIPEGSGLPLVAGLAALDRGRVDDARTWFDLATKARDPAIATLAAGARGAADLRAVVALPLTTSPIPGRLAEHLAARDTGDCTKVLARAKEPFVEEVYEGASHRYYDPLLVGTVAACHGHQARAVLGQESPLLTLARPPEGAEPLVNLLFSGIATEADAASEAARSDATLSTLGLRAPTLAALELPVLSGDADDPELALGFARTLNEKLDLWAADRLYLAPPEGQALFNDLRLGAVWRSQLFLVVARDALARGCPRQALALAWSALDLENASFVTPINHPGLLAVIVEGQLKTGRTREALEAMQPLLNGYPFLLGLNESIGDLAILDGMSRYGDSKEN